MPKGNSLHLLDYTSESCSVPPRKSICLLPDKPEEFHNTQTAAQKNTTALLSDRRKPTFLVTQESSSRPQRAKCILYVSLRIDGIVSFKASSRGDVHDPSHKMNKEYAYQQTINAIRSRDGSGTSGQLQYIHCTQGPSTSLTSLK